MTIPRERTSDLPPPGASDWAEEFYAHGWHGPHGCYPWVVVERVVSTARRFEQALREARATEGWAFGLCSYRVLDAPTFDIHADTAARQRIVGAIRESATRRATEFDQYWRPHWEAKGLPAALITQITPRPDEPLTEESFNWPVLLVATEPDTGKLVLLGSLASMDILLHALVARHDLDIDEALALLVLLTCHGKPAEVKYETAADGTVVPRFTFAASAFTQPFHPERFTQIRLALWATTDSTSERRAALLRLLAEHIPGVITSLRRKPPPASRTVHSVARSRLAESVSDALLGRSRRERRGHRDDPWWDHLDVLSLRQRRRFFSSLSDAERKELKAVRAKRRSLRNPNTRRVLLHRAKAKLRSILREASV
jgi:hypothetical protein